MRISDWSSDVCSSDLFTAYAPHTIEWLAERGVTLIGLDTPSIDPASSKTLDSHHVILRRDMRVLENLLLDDIAEGDYELIALPQIGRASFRERVCQYV